MAKSESPTQEWTLASVEAGRIVEVVAVHAEDPTALLVHGIRPGVQLSVDADAPFGGPRIVRIGGCRVAVDRRLARSVYVASADVPADDPSASRRA